ncbi:hypothetical protein SKB0092_16790 [Roseomonas mucosa]
MPRTGPTEAPMAERPMAAWGEDMERLRWVEGARLRAKSDGRGKGWGGVFRVTGRTGDASAR